MRTALLTLTTCLFVLPAQAKYSGGTGEPNDPYQITTPADLIALGETPEDYDKHFILTADIDLDPNLPGRKVFDKAVIAPDTDNARDYFQGRPFGGVFDGKGHTVSHLTIKGKDCLGLFGQLEYAAEVKDLGVVDVKVTGSGSYVGGLVGDSHDGAISNCYSTGVVNGGNAVGGLVGNNYWGRVTICYSTCAVSGGSWVGSLVGGNRGTISNCCTTGTASGAEYVGGLVGANGGKVARCFSMSLASGGSAVGGLVGLNWLPVPGPTGVSPGSIAQCYSTGSVRGGSSVGGLVGANPYGGSIDSSFWDMQTSGQTSSDGGTGKTTAEMQMASTLLGWGCTPAVWTIDEGRDYPRLTWEGKPGEALPVLADFVAGSGSQDDPYLICTGDDLNTIGLFLFEWDKRFKLIADIDMSGFDGKDGRPGFNLIGISYASPHISQGWWILRGG